MVCLPLKLDWKTICWSFRGVRTFLNDHGSYICKKSSSCIRRYTPLIQRLKIQNVVFKKLLLTRDEAAHACFTAIPCESLPFTTKFWWFFIFLSLISSLMQVLKRQGRKEAALLIDPCSSYFVRLVCFSLPFWKLETIANLDLDVWIKCWVAN